MHCLVVVVIVVQKFKNVLLYNIHTIYLLFRGVRDLVQYTRGNYLKFLTHNTHYLEKCLLFM